MKSIISNYTENLPEVHHDELEIPTKELLENDKPKKTRNHLYMIWIQDLDGRLTAKWTLQD